MKHKLFKIILFLTVTLAASLLLSHVSGEMTSLEAERETFARDALRVWQEMSTDPLITQKQKNTFVERVKTTLEEYKKKIGSVKGSQFTCTICVVVIKIIELQVEDNRDNIKNQLVRLCDIVPEKVRSVCKFTIDLFADQIIDMILQKVPPDVVCNKFSIFDCNGCYLEDRSVASTQTEEAKKREIQALVLAAIVGSRSMRADQRFENEVAPALDADGDLMPPVHRFVRGADWRGMDCNDNDPNVRPGLLGRDANVDSNCNGIVGMYPNTDSTYEDIYCSGANSTLSQRTVVMFGDSASSCFHIPPEYLHLKNLTDIIYVLMNEFDYPQLSWSTGFDDNTEGQSIYLKMKERNRCNHRDYQNLGHNGHRMTHFAKVQVPVLAIDPQKSKPILAFNAYIGNDVCKDTLDRMTKVEDYIADLKRGLTLLDERVPPGSKMLIQGLVDGRILWDAMNSLTHPLGVTYRQMYEFLSCTEANPCQTWLTPNKASRDATSEHAAKLSNAAKALVESSKGKYKNLELGYMEFPIKDAVKYVESIGMTADVLISPFDGFHLSIYGHRVMAMLVNQFLEKNHPHWLGPVNPYNKAIETVFGDQGGH